MIMFRFATPYFLLLLFLIPAAIYFKRSKRHRLAMGNSDLVPVTGIRPSFALKIRWFVPVLKYAALCLMIIALARPQWGTQQMNIRTQGINIILAVDLSESMAALDFKKKKKIINRLEAVKGVVRTFVAGRKGDRIGMVVFGTHAYTQLPLTRDYNTIVSMLERLEIGVAGKSTAIGDAIGISLKRLQDIKSKSNVMILLTDGRSNSGALSPEAAAEIAVQKGVKVYTIGVGSRGKAPFLIKDPIFGERYVYQRVDIDEDTLKTIAQKTGGLYFRAEDLNALKQIYETIDRMETTEVEVNMFSQFDEMYTWFLLPALGLLGLWIVLVHTRFLSVP